MASTPPNSEAFMREVDEELRRDQALGIWKTYGRWIVVAVIAALIAFGGWLYWQNRLEAKAGVEGEQLTAAIDELAAGREAGVAEKLAPLKESRSDATRAAALTTLAGLALQKGDTKDAARQFGAVAADASLDQAFRDMALVRQTAIEFDTLKPQQVIDRLKPLAVAGSPWFGSAGEMVGIAYLREGKDDLAGATFAAMAKDEGVPESIRSRVVQLAGVLGVDALPEKGLN